MLNVYAQYKFLLLSTSLHSKTLGTQFFLRSSADKKGTS